MTRRLILLLLLLQGPTAPAPERPAANPGSIEGAVVGTDSEPIEDARVTLIKPRSSLPSGFDTWAFAEAISVTSDRDGRFTFAGLTPGPYKLAVAASGYVSQEYGQRAFPGQGAPIEVTAGRPLNGIVVRLTPTGVISGRLVDREKLPLAGMSVRLMSYAYNATGQRVLRVVQSVFTNDRGEYRLYFITPGPYVLNAGTPQGPGGRYEGKPASGNNGIEEAHTFTFYPGVTRVSEATVLEVRAGAELGGIDWSIGRVQRHTVRGRVIDAADGQPPAGVELILNYRDLDNIDRDFKTSGGSFQVRYEKGSFEFSDVLPGVYSVSGSLGERESQRTGNVQFEVSASDVEGLVLTIPRGASIRGRWSTDTGAPLSALRDLIGSADESGGPRYGVVAVWLEPSVNGWIGSATAPGAPTPQRAELNADGTFVIANVAPGEYRVSLMAKSPFYLKEARFDGAEVLEQPLNFSGQDSGVLTVSIGSMPAAVEGTAVNERMEPVLGSLIVLMPDRRDRIDLYKNTTSDQNGRFRFSNVTPGDYQIFAWEAIEPFAYFDPQLMRQVEGKGMAARLGELSKLNVSVRVIP